MQKILGQVAKFCGEEEFEKFPGLQSGLKETIPSESLVRHRPLIQELHFVSWNEETGIFQNKNSSGFALEIHPPSFVDSQSFDSICTWFLAALPVDVDFQWLLHASPDISPFLNTFREFRGRSKNPTHTLLAKKRTEFLASKTWDSLDPLYPLLLRNFRLFAVVSVETRLSKKVELQFLAERLMSVLRSAQFQPKLVCATALLNLVQECIHPGSETRNQEWHPRVPLFEQMADVASRLTVHPHELLSERIDTGEIRSIRTFSPRMLPSEFSQSYVSELIGQMFSRNFQLPCPVWVSLAMRTANLTSSRLHAKRKVLSLRRLAEQGLSRFFPAIPRHLEDYEHFEAALNAGDKECKVLMQVVLVAPQDCAEDAEARIKSLYSSFGFKLIKNKYVQCPSWLSILPFRSSEGAFHDARIFGQTHSATLKQAIHIAPLSGEWKGNGAGGLIFAGRKGQVATWWPFNSPSNYNICVAGTSGSGKSVLIQELASSILAAGGRVWIIDSGRSFEKLCSLMSGTFLSFEAGKKISLNPFSNIEKLDFEQQELLKSLICAMARPNCSVSREEENRIEQAVSAVWQDKGADASLEDVVVWLSSHENKVCRDIGLLLYPYGPEGRYRDYFSGKSNWNVDDAFFLLELQELQNSPELQKMVLLMVIFRIYSAMCLGDKSQVKCCIVDEAHGLLDQGAATFIEKGYRTARKYNTSFVSISQSVSDFKASATGEVIWANSAHKICFKQTDSIVAKMRKDGDIQDSDFIQKLHNTLESSPLFSEFIIHSPGGASIHRLILDSYSRLLYSSSAEDFAAVKELMDRGYSCGDAIELIVEGGEKNVR